MKFERIKQRLVRLEELHLSHMDSLAHDSAADIDERMIEQGYEFSSLKEDMALFLSEIHQADLPQIGPTIREVEGMIRTLIHQNKNLQSIIQNHQNTIKKNLKEMKTGRKVMKAYGSSTLAPQKPKILSITK